MTTDRGPTARETTTCNLAVVRGCISGPAEVRVLPSGQRVGAFAVRTELTGGGATSVPVSWWNPPAWIETVEPATIVIVVGTVRRRFFRTAAGLGSKTEVEASLVRRGTARDRDAAWRRATDLLEAL